MPVHIPFNHSRQPRTRFRGCHSRKSLIETADPCAKIRGIEKMGRSFPTTTVSSEIFFPSQNSRLFRFIIALLSVRLRATTSRRRFSLRDPLRLRFETAFSGNRVANFIFACEAC